MKKLDPELLRIYMMGGASPGKSTNKLQSKAKDVVDLHVDQTRVGKGKIEKGDVIIFQLRETELAIDAAIAEGKFELRIIHGVGDGKLKKELHRLLQNHPHVKSYSNDYHSKYGYGSTLVVFK